MTQDAQPTPSDIRLARRLKRRRIFCGLLLSAIIFAGGGVTGWSVALRHHAHGNPERADPPVAEVVDRMKHELFLNDEQTKQITDIYTKRFAALHAIRIEMLPKLKTEYDGLRSDVQKILTPAQFAGWDQRFEATRNRMLPPPSAAPRPENRLPPDPEGLGPHGSPPDRDGLHPFDGPPPDRNGPRQLPPPPGAPE